MEISHIKKVKTLLKSRHDALSKRVHNRNGIAVEKAADTMDEVALAEERDLATRLLERDFADIRLVEAALARIKNGTYGLCLRCDEPISLNRLRVMPHAAFCVDCQEAVERDGASAVSLDEGVASELLAH